VVGEIGFDGAEVQNLVDTLARFGSDPAGGTSRVVYSHSWLEAVSEVSGWFADAGLDVSRDAVGNVFGVERGRFGRGLILTGSHLDTARQGGNYDGAAGLICSFLATRELKRHFGPPRQTLAVVAISDEESSRFASNLWGSRAINGRIDSNEAYSIYDDLGVSLAQAMTDCGFDPSAVRSAQRRDIECFLELHIEQGPVLEQRGDDVGIVTSITGFDCSTHRVVGTSNHAGGTPLTLRRDALQAAVEMAATVERIAEEFGDPARATVGRMAAFPGAINIIAGRAEFTTDLRHPDPDQLTLLAKRVREALVEIARRRQVELVSSPFISQPPVPMDASLADLFERCASALGVKALRLHSGGGHDAMIFAQSGVPAALLFVPSRGGISHAPEEFTSAAQLAEGARVLAAALHDLAY
jgi:allantoate deiminase